MNGYSPTRLPAEDRHLTVAIWAVLASVLLHVAFYETVSGRHLGFFESALSTYRTPSKKPTPATRAELAPPPAPTPADPLRTAAGAGASGSGSTASTLDRLAQDTAAALFEPPPATPEKTVTPGLDRIAPPPQPDLPVWQPQQEILSLLDAVTRDERAPIPRREIPAVERQRLAPDVTAAYDLLAGLPATGTGGEGTPALAPSPVSVALAPSSLPRGGNEAWPVPEMGPVAEGETSTSLMAELPAQVAPAYPIEDRLRVSVTTYAPAGSGGYLYFRIDVDRKDRTALPALPRDIIFVQDVSASIGDILLRPCQLALVEALGTLRPEDRFNVLRFRDTVTPCFGEWRSPTPEALAQAKGFVETMKSEGQTDLFASMAEVLKFPRTPGRPALAVIVTDGNVTAGQLARDSQIIGTFTRLNVGEVSVFTVGVSRSANVYLLDMLAQSNRGGATALPSDRFSVGNSIRDVCAGIARPVLAAVRFNFDVVSGAEVYPTLTTNLYEDRPLQLFGRVRAHQPVVAFQARGEAGTARYDMLFEVNLRGAEVRVGTRDLVVQWATQRMYDLVTRFARTEDPELVAEMSRLGTEFGITVPYKSRLTPAP